MSGRNLNDLLPNLNNAGRRLVLSEIVGRPKAYTMSRPRRPAPSKDQKIDDDQTPSLPPLLKKP